MGGETSVRCSLEERGTCREARFQSRCRGTGSISGEVQDGGCGSDPVAPPNLTRWWSWSSRRSDHMHTLLTHYPPPVTKPWTEIKIHQQFWNFLRKLSDNILVKTLKSTKSHFTFQAVSKVRQLPTKKCGEQDREPPPYSNSGTRGMRVHQTFLKNQYLITGL